MGDSSLPRGVRVKNRAPAPIQITAEQILVEARERAAAAAPPAPRRHITDPAELSEHRMRIRKDYEDRLRRLNKSVGTWLRYAKWEEGQGEVARARSIYERTLDVDSRDASVWLRYAEMEMRNKFVNRARNVLDRAVGLLPRIESLWYKYAFMEEMLGNVAGVRVLFERWMGWEPGEQAWLSFAAFEARCGAMDHARAVYERFIACHPSQAAYLKYARWEDRGGQKALARRVFERSLDELRDGERDEALYAAFAAFEEACGEEARARAVFQLGLQRLPKDRAAALQATFLAFEKQHGSVAGIEDAIITRRREAYEALVAANPLNYDAWFDYVRLEESEVVNARGSSSSSSSSSSVAPPPASQLERAREVFERAIASTPPVVEKRYWRRYVYLWISYALFEELVALDAPRARAVLREALKLIPHRTFTFAKLWVLAAHAEVRAKDVGAARKLLGTAVGMCPKPKILSGYIELELALGEMDRVRKLYEKWISLSPSTVGTWTAYAELEKGVGEVERARAIYDLAISQPELDRPEVAWKSFIDFEIEAGELASARDLYQRLLARTEHVKVVLAFASFEASVAGDTGRARQLFEQGYAQLKRASGSSAAGGGAEAPPTGSAAALVDSDALEARQQRALLLEAWRAFEQGCLEAELRGGGDGSATQPLLRAVEARLPRMVRRRRPLWAGGATLPPNASGTVPPVSHEEYSDFLFPDDDVKPAHLKLLEAAARWKAAAASGGAGGGWGAGAGGGGATRALAQAAAADRAGSSGGAEEDENEVDLEGAADALVLSAILAGAKRGREGEGEEEGQGEGEGQAASAGAGVPAEDANALDLDDLPLPPPPPQRPRMALPPPTQ